MRAMIGANPDSRIRYFEPDTTLIAKIAGRNRHRALISELDGVAEQVLQNGA
jgi:hypothetical protein